MGIGGTRYLLLQLADGSMGFVPEDAWIPARQVTATAEAPAPKATRAVQVKKPRKPRETEAKPGKAHPSKNGSAPKAEREAVIAEFTAGLTLAQARVKYPDEPYARLWSWSKAAEARA
jgi:hypothetical protein